MTEKKVVITDHACERYLERVLLQESWSELDFKEIKYKIRTIMFTNKHKKLYKNDKVIKVLITDLIFVFNKTKRILKTIYPATEKLLMTLNNLTFIELNKERFDRFKTRKNHKKKHYVKPDCLYVLEKEGKVFITVDDTINKYNLSGCFKTIEKAQRLIEDYKKFCNIVFCH